MNADEAFPSIRQRNDQKSFGKIVTNWNRDLEDKLPTIDELMRNNEDIDIYRSKKRATKEIEHQ